MTTNPKIRPYLLGLALLSLTSCNKQTLPERCNKAIIIAQDCAFIARIEGASVGETWHGTTNCVTITDLPAEAQTVGSSIYFTSYAPGSGPFCTADKAYDYPRTVIKPITYSITNCP